MNRQEADTRLASALSTATGDVWAPDRDSFNVTAAASFGGVRVTRCWRGGRVTLWDRGGAVPSRHVGTFEGRGWEERAAKAVHQMLLAGAS